MNADQGLVHSASESLETLEGGEQVKRELRVDEARYTNDIQTMQQNIIFDFASGCIPTR